MPRFGGAVRSPARRIITFFAALVLLLLLVAGSPAPGTETTLSLRTGTALAADGKAVITLGTSVSSEHFVVHANTKEVGEQTLVLAENAWDQLAHHFRHLPSDGVVILVVEDDSEFDAIQPAPRTRGFATYGGNRIYLRGRDVDQETVAHELTHILLGANVRPGVNVPDWFNEGLAQYASGARDSGITLLYAYHSGDFLSLNSLSQVDALHGPNRRMATIQGLAVITFLVDRYGESNLWVFVARLGRSPSFEQALADTYGSTRLELDADWAAYAEDRYGFISPAAFQFVGWALMGLLAMVGAFMWLTRKVILLHAGDTDDLTSEEIAGAQRAEHLLRYQENLSRRGDNH